MCYRSYADGVYSARSNRSFEKLIAHGATSDGGEGYCFKWASLSRREAGNEKALTIAAAAAAILNDRGHHAHINPC